MMSKLLTVRVGHGLSQDVALQCMRGLLTRMAARDSGKLSIRQEVWSGCRNDFRITAYGLEVAGTLTVESSQVTFAAKLPIRAIPFKGSIASKVEGAVRDAFSRVATKPVAAPVEQAASGDGAPAETLLGAFLEPLSREDIEAEIVRARRFRKAAETLANRVVGLLKAGRDYPEVLASLSEKETALFSYHMNETTRTPNEQEIDHLVSLSAEDLERELEKEQKLGGLAAELAPKLSAHESRALQVYCLQEAHIAALFAGVSFSLYKSKQEKKPAPAIVKKA